MSFFGGSNISGNRRRIKYYENEVDSISQYPSIGSAHGTWVNDDTNNQSATASSWFMTNEYDSGGGSPNIDLSTWSYDTSTHTLTEISHFDLHSGLSRGVGWSQSTGDIICVGTFYRSGSGYPNNWPSTAYVAQINSTLTGIDAGDSMHSTGSGPYGGVHRGGEDLFFYSGMSGNIHGHYAIKTTDGDSSEYGGLNDNNWYPSDGSSGNSHIAGTGMSYIGGNGGTYSEPTHNYDYFIMNFGGSGGTTGGLAFSDDTTRVNFEVNVWDGGTNEDQANTFVGGLITLPTHTGSTKYPNTLPTTWGNVVLHFNTNDGSGAGCYPITWSGTTPTAGTFDSWAEYQTVPLDNLFLDQTLRGGSGGRGNKYGNGQHPDDLDVYRTIAFYEESGSTYIDFVELEFRYVGGVLKHSAYVIHKKAYSINKTAVGIGGMIFQKNKKDVLILFTATDVSDNTKHKYVYFEGAYR